MNTFKKKNYKTIGMLLIIIVVVSKFLVDFTSKTFPETTNFIHLSYSIEILVILIYEISFFITIHRSKRTKI